MKKVMFFVMFIFMINLVYAAPSINPTGNPSSLSDGESYTIVGNEFGIKSPAEPLLWDDFEDEPPGVSMNTDD